MVIAGKRLDVSHKYYYDGKQVLVSKIDDNVYMMEALKNKGVQVNSDNTFNISLDQYYG